MILAVLLACGECVFDETVTGRVTTSDGVPLEGVEVSSCAGDRCAYGDIACATTTTGLGGLYALPVPMCRPEAFACELSPIRVEAEGCETAEVRTGLSPGPVDIVVECP
ncbi:MAG: hypothetical protein KC656_01670 [Myxococcales bacterium]|nr:hypothetical protein [Myxococcales bacterium]